MKADCFQTMSEGSKHESNKFKLINLTKRRNETKLKIRPNVLQLTSSSRRENGGAYGGDVFGEKRVVSKGKIFQITCSV